MKLTQVRICNFQSFGPEPTTITLESMTYLLGPNGAGKTAVLVALARLFSFDPSLRRIRRADFHVSLAAGGAGGTQASQCWIEAEFSFPETNEAAGEHPAVPAHFAHMRLDSAEGVPKIRIRLDASLDADAEIEETISYVIEAAADGSPTKTVPVNKHDRSSIQVHYLPARRDPTDHISYAANSLLGRALRAAKWQNEHESIGELTAAISQALACNDAIKSIDEHLASHWQTLHKGQYYHSPSLSFESNEIESLLRHLTVAFAPGHDEASVDFSRLSDGQKSLLYVSLVLSMHGVARKVLAGELDAFDLNKLRPAVFTLVAMEEPENSLSPHYLGRVIRALSEFAAKEGSQSLVATHAPSLLRRVKPEHVRHLRLSASRTTVVKSIALPSDTDVANKFVREAVQAFPELYFARLVILGEGDSEEVVLPRLLRAMGLADDESSITVAPLGGRHVNHFWRLLHSLDIPHFTLLDLDLARHQGGWGRVKYAAQQLLDNWGVNPNLSQAQVNGIPTWNGATELLIDANGADWLKWLETQKVYFSSPLDLDFSMMKAFPSHYGVGPADLVLPDADTTKAVLGKAHHNAGQYPAGDQKLFQKYHERFKLGSKPSAHLQALATIGDASLVAGAPASLKRLVEAAKTVLGALPE